MKLEHNAKIQSLLSLSMTKKQMVMTSSAGREKKKKKKKNDTRHLIAKSFMTAEILGRKTNEEAATVMRFKKKKTKQNMSMFASHIAELNSHLSFSA